MKTIKFYRKLSTYGHDQLVISIPSVIKDMLEKDKVYEIKINPTHEK